MNIIKYNTTDPIWIKFQKFCSSLSKEDRYAMLDKQINFINYLHKERNNPNYHPIGKVYLSVLKEEYVNNFRLTKEIYEKDFQTNPYFMKQLDVWGRLLNPNSLSVAWGKRCLASFLIECERLANPRILDDKKPSIDIYASLQAIFKSDEEIIKEFEYNGVCEKDAKSFLLTVNSYILIKNHFKEWLMNGYIEFKYNTYKIPFEKIFSDKILIKAALHALYVNVAIRELY